MAIFSTGAVLLVSLVIRSGLGRWLCALTIPFVFAYSLYWLPVWLGAAGASEYSVWELLGVTVWFLAGAVPSTVAVEVLRRRTSK